MTHEAPTLLIVSLAKRLQGLSPQQLYAGGTNKSQAFKNCTCSQGTQDMHDSYIYSGMTIYKTFSLEVSKIE